MHAIKPVAVRRVDAIRSEQADLVVVAKHPRRNVAEARELSDVQHGVTIVTPSHGVRVKFYVPAIAALGVARAESGRRQ
jgi:hypothetical protein